MRSCEQGSGATRRSIVRQHLVPLDWKVDAALLRAVVKVRLAEMG